jgi:hypothetical protein
MPYLLYKTNGKVLTTINDSDVDISTSLNLVGKNYAGYGLAVNENFVYLLENFSNTSAPAKPIIGQTWFDSTPTQNKLKVYDGASFKGLATIRIQNTVPISSVVGDLWWDTQNTLLKGYDGSTYQIIGPSLSIKANWLPSDEYSGISSPAITVLRGSIGNKAIAVMSENNSYEVYPGIYGFAPNGPGYASPDLDPTRFPNVIRGITLAGANDDPAIAPLGSTRGSNYYLWGTAAEALSAVQSSSVSLTSSTLGATFFVPLASTSTGVSALSVDSGITYNPGTPGVLNTVASSARFADLAERYEADDVYEVGTVLVIGGTAEVTTTYIPGDVKVIGIVSKNPAYRMNSEAGTDETHPYIALKGRVPCMVVGRVHRGDLLVTSSTPGYAQAMTEDHSPNGVIGKALGSQDQGFGVIEVLVV